MAGIGSESKSKREQQEQQSQGGKHCIVRFRPVDGWDGSYGFDWFRAAGDYEDKISKSANTANYESIIGKYMGMTGSARMYFNWEGKPNCIENTPLEPSCMVETDPDQTEFHFCQYYLKRDGMRVPVEENGGNYSAWHYTDDTDSPWEETKFSSFSARTSFRAFYVDEKLATLYCKLLERKEYTDPQTQEKKIKYEWSDEEEFHARSEFDDDAMERYSVSKKLADSFFKNGKDRLTAKFLEGKGYKAETRYSIRKKVWIELGGKRYYFEYINKKLEIVKVYDFKKAIEKLNFDNLIDKYKQYKDNRVRNDCITELSKKHHPYFVLGFDDKKKNWDPDKAKSKGDSKYDKEIKKEREDAESIARTETGNDNIKSLHKNGKLKFPDMFLDTAKIDEYSLRNVEKLNDRPSAFFIEISPVYNLKEEKLTVSKEDNKSPLYSAMNDDNLLVVSEVCDDKLLHPYWVTYLPSEVNVVFDHNAGKEKLYPPCLLGLSQFGSKKEHKRFGKMIYDEADVQVKVQGDFDKITFVSTNPDNLKVSPESMSNPQKNKLNIKVKGVCRETEYIIAKDEYGKSVGFLEVRVWPPIPIHLMIVTVKLTGGDHVELPDEDYDKEMKKEGGWNSDNDNHHQILAQAGVIPYESKISFDVPEKELLEYMNDEKTIVRYNDLHGVSIGDKIDELFIHKLHGSETFMRVYVLDCKCVVNDFIVFGGTFERAGQKFSMLFKKSIDQNASDMKEILGHELLHQLGLDHSFDNNSPVTFKREQTSNVMDFSERTMSLCSVQWNAMRHVAQQNWTKWSK